MLESPSIRIPPYLDAIERWRDEPDVPSYIEALISTPVRDLHIAQLPTRVSMESSILQTIESFKDSQNVVVNRIIETEDSVEITELIFNRMTFLEHALQAPSFLDPLSNLFDKVPSLGWVDENDTLDIALHRMMDSGFEEVGIMSGGMMAGVLHVKDLFDFLLREVAVSSDFEQKLVRVGAQATFRTTSLGGQSVLAAVREQDQKEISPLRLSAVEWCESGWTECLLMCCILLDLICVFVEWIISGQEDSAEAKLLVATGIILFVFVFEVVVRWVGRRTTLFVLPFEILDVSIVVVSALVYIVVLVASFSSSSNSKTIVTIMRILRLLRQIKIIRYLYKIYKIQQLRYSQDGFNLDLSYITSSCIAMSQPVLMPYANFVNPLKELRRFFSTKYPGRYHVYNLCAETCYEDEFFGGRVERIMIENHNPPKMHQMITFVEHAGRFLEEDPLSCIAVHCSSGLGRTGVMVAAWLLYSTFSDTADDAMKWFSSRRTGSNDSTRLCFPMASQLRYVAYMQQVLVDGGYCTKRINLTRITVQTCPKMDSTGCCNIWFTIEEGGQEVFCSTTSDGIEGMVRMTKAQDELSFELNLLLSSDIRIVFYHQDIARGRQQLCFFVCFHTGFIRSNSFRFDKQEIDMASNDPTNKVFDANFAVLLSFADIHLPGHDEAASKEFVAGSFRKLSPPSSKVTEAAALMRCRDSTVQAKLAKRLKTKVGLDFQLENGGTLSDQDHALVEGSDQIADNLCCAEGPIVKHEAVDMFKVETEGAHAPFKPTSLTKSSSLDAFKPLTRSVQGLARSLVSGNKRRFLAESFDLDLTYVTPRVIAMGYPSSGLEKNYRNSADDVYRFFQERHAAHYLIVNLCSEREYDLDTFHGNCVRYPFADHSPPALELILPCCAYVHKFLQADENNVIAIHCKAGKGRTGLIVVAYLMYCGLKSNCIAARSHYDWARTKDGKGLTIISQIRYAHYFEQQLRVLKSGGEPLITAQNQAVALSLLRIRLHSVPRVDSNGACCPSFSVSVKSEVDHKPYEIHRSKVVQPSISSKFCDLNTGTKEGLRVAGDFQLLFYHQGKVKIFSFWLHTALVVCPPPEMGGIERQLSESECISEDLPSSTRSLVLSKHEIDTAAKDKRCNRFDRDFKVEIFFSKLPGQRGTGSALEMARERSKDSNVSKADDYPLYQDRENYKRLVQSNLTSNGPIPSFEDWLLGKARDLQGNGLDGGSSRSQDAKLTSIGKGAKRAYLGHDASTAPTPKAKESFVEADLGFATPDGHSKTPEFVTLDLWPAASSAIPSSEVSIIPSPNGGRCYDSRPDDPSAPVDGGSAPEPSEGPQDFPSPLSSDKGVSSTNEWVGRPAYSPPVRVPSVVLDAVGVGKDAPSAPGPGNDSKQLLGTVSTLSGGRGLKASPSRRAEQLQAVLTMM